MAANAVVSTTSTVSSNRWIKVWTGIVAASAFGPYVHGHIDAGQLIVSASGAAVLLIGWKWMLADRAGPPMWLVTPWMALYAIMALATVVHPSFYNPYGQLPVFDALGAYALPMALVLLAWFWKQFIPVRELVITAAQVFVVGMTLNAAIALSELATSNVQGIGFVQRFWSLPAAVGTVGLNASINGRYIGIFYQPAIAGVAYGIALICVIYLSRIRGGLWARFGVPIGIVICLGGLVSISKVFLLGGLPIAAITVIGQRRVAWKATGSTALTLVGIWFAGKENVLPAWTTGRLMLNQLYDPHGSLVTAFSAGRYGAGSVLSPIAEAVLRSSPWVGYGAGGLNTAYDSLWIETLAVSGVAGVAALLWVVIALLTTWIGSRRWLASSEWRLLGGTIILGVGSSFGVPSLIGDRISVIIWLMIGFLISPQPGGTCNASGGVTGISAWESG